MTRLIPWCRVILFLLLGAAVAGCAPVPASLNVLMISAPTGRSWSGDGHGQRPDHAEPTLDNAGWLARRLAERGDVAIRHVTIAGSLRATLLDGVDVVVLDNTLSADLLATFRHRLSARVMGTADDTKPSGMVALGLAATGSLAEPAWGQWLGGSVEQWGPISPLDLVAMDPAQPIMLGIGRWLTWVDRVPAAVSLQGGEPLLLTAEGTPAAWTYHADAMRLVVLALGGSTTIREDEGFVTLVHNAIRWAAGETHTAHNRLALAEQKAGYQLLFDGCDLTGWTGDPAAWTAGESHLEGCSSGKGVPELTWRPVLRQFMLKFWYRQPAGDARLLLRPAITANVGTPSPIPGPADTACAVEEELLSISRGAVHGSESDCVPPGWNEVRLMVRDDAVTTVVNGMPAPKRPRGALAGQPVRLSWSLLDGAPGHLLLRDIRLLPQPRPAVRR